jgi:hypothetical protein
MLPGARRPTSASPGGDGIRTASTRTEHRRNGAMSNAANETGQVKKREVCNRRAGYDFTFSLPKSVSVYLAKDEDVKSDEELESERRYFNELFGYQEGSKI